MPMTSIVLSEDQAEIVDRFVRSGRYASASEVIADGLQLLEQDAKRSIALKEAAAAGFSDIEQGRYLDVSVDRVDALMEELDQSARALARKSGS